MGTYIVDLHACEGEGGGGVDNIGGDNPPRQKSGQAADSSPHSRMWGAYDPCTEVEPEDVTTVTYMMVAVMVLCASMVFLAYLNLFVFSGRRM